MTRSTNMEHVEVLRELEQDGDAGLTEREREAIRQVIASLSSPKPEGEWVLVPREASSEMLTAAIDAHLGFEGEDEVDAVWAAMISAAEQFGATAGHAVQDVGDGAEGGSRAPTRPTHFSGMFPRQDDPASSSFSHQAVDVGQFRPAVATHQLACRKRVRDCREGLLPTDNLPIYLEELAEANRLLDVVDRAAPQPPAEAQPVAWLGANPRTGVPVMAVRTPAPSVMRDFAMRPLYANPPPSAPVGVEGEAKARLFCLAEEEISSGTLDDLIDEAIDYDIVEPGDTLRVEEWVRVREFEVGPEDDERLAAQQGGGEMDAWLEVNNEADVRLHVEAYVAHATSAKDAEIEALRRELDRLRGEHVRVRRDRNAAEARAERLAEALRRAEGLLRSAGIIAESDLERPHSIATEIKNALRDHDQEGKDG